MKTSRPLLDSKELWRSILYVYVQLIGFKTNFRTKGIVNDGEAEFSYPAIISDGEGGAHVSYTFERRGIKYVHVPASQLN